MKWEYKYLTIDEDDMSFINRIFNRNGDDGWEAYATEASPRRLMVFLKRPKNG